MLDRLKNDLQTTFLNLSAFFNYIELATFMNVVYVMQVTFKGEITMDKL